MSRAHTATFFVFLTLFLTLGIPADLESATLHEEGVLTPGSSSTHVGGTLDVRGSDFTGGTTYTLRLEGTLASYEVATVTADAEGTFQTAIEVPADARPGSYRLVAVAPDGDEAATADLVLEAAAEDASPGRAAPADGGTEEAPVARAEERDFERSWTGVEWFVIGLALGGGLVGGLTLYRSRSTEA